MKNFNFKKVLSLIMAVLAITQVCVMILLICTGNIYYLYGGVSLLLSATCLLILFGKYMD